MHEQGLSGPHSNTVRMKSELRHGASNVYKKEKNTTQNQHSIPKKHKMKTKIISPQCCLKKGPVNVEGEVHTSCRASYGCF